MARPSKNVKVQSSKMGKDEIRTRFYAEESLKGKSDEIKPSSRLNSNQKKVFNYIVANLEQSQLLGNLDVYLLEATSIAIDRLQNIEKEINRDFTLIYSKELMAAKAKYTTDFHKGMQELSLSPQSRAKFGILAVGTAQAETDPLLKILKGGKNEASM
jgi:P27 family predicted phage terminase small subunit